MYGGITNRQKEFITGISVLLYRAGPVGALMFTGEWGCGKTYLIDHELKATFDGQNGREEKVIIRVSLFGVSSVENIHSLVKESWMEAYYENFPTVLKKTTRFLKNIQSSIAKMEGNDEMKLLHL